MELRFVDPKSLLDNPNNPRTTAPNAEADRRFAFNIKAAGVIHPPIVREMSDGSLMIIAGHRRRRASVLAKFDTIPVLVTSAPDKLDGLVAGSENIIRENMTQSEQWRFVDGMRREKQMSDGQIAKALMVTPAYLKQLSLLAGLHEPILDAIDIGRGPDDRELKIIATASLDDQRAVWAELFAESVEDDTDPAEYRLKADDPDDEVPWTEIARAFSQDRYYARDARFDREVAKARGIAWTEDLFGEGGQDNRFTEDGRAYGAAQEDWLAQSLPEGGILLEAGEHGRPVMPEGYVLVYSYMAKRETDSVGYFLNPNSLKIEEIAIRESLATVDPERRSVTRLVVPEKPRERAEISGTGLKIIGEVRTRALHAALDAAEEDVDPWDLVAALLLALKADNVTVQGDSSHTRYHQPSARDFAMQALFPEGVLVRDPGVLRHHAVAVLKSVANCTVSLHSGSGLPAQIMGLLFNADAHMPSMAFEDFLKCYSKPGIMNAGQGLGLAAHETGKGMRQAILAHVGQDGRWVPAAAGFTQGVAAWEAEFAKKAAQAAAWNADDEEDGLEDAEEDDRVEIDDVEDTATQEGGEEDTTPDPDDGLKERLIEAAVVVAMPGAGVDQDNAEAARDHLRSHLEVIQVA
ncbi:ParB/RepB/Spo0J family partition protein [Acetobacter sp. TBRC 12305]|uniref:ParB/RepB/Spo0J family partition protein n=1 Tax=Acetobacter garciniae TaxID=2817435 RepID=A0A939HPF3_9PROT|nr:ParB/RepB/Spo0J family partition protein [Acetobacter garciniae]MBO1326196.1 ParB/RepB/Spo0J family partition protein [Acetobacter garciniae]MBX0346067.1 ParB/RepB/Spo0J family partition protein [Acetobacter garciniae]